VNKIKLISLILSALILTSLSAKPVSIIGQSPENTTSISKIDHSAFASLLNQYVDSNGNVDYTGWKTNDKESLKLYLESLTQADPDKKTTREHKLAYWINAYNALTIYGILEKYPTSSIRNHTSRLFGYNIWKDLKLQVADIAYSLDDIEHKVLRKMQEPRIHFAIVCASHSCPQLLSEAYTQDKLNEQLNDNALNFFSNEDNFRIDEKKRIIYLSSILDWFSEDFGDNTAEVIESIRNFLPESENEISHWKVRYLPYSWKLNDQKTAGKRRD
jgi:hypothetical protein